MEYNLRKRAEIVLLAQKVAKSLKADPLIEYFEALEGEKIAGKTIEQKDASGCGIACVSALSGRDYDKVKQAFEDIIIGMAASNVHLLNGGLTRGQLVDLLEIHNIDVPVIKGPAIILTDGHYIAVNETGEIINPTY